MSSAEPLLPPSCPATITEATDYAEGVRRGVGRAVRAARRPRGGRGAVRLGRHRFRTQLTKLLGENPDALHVAAQSEFTAGTIIKQARELGYDGPIYGEDVAIGTTALEIAGEAATRAKAVIADIDPGSAKGQELLAKSRERYGYLTLSRDIGSAYDDVHIAAACLEETDDDHDAPLVTGDREKAIDVIETAQPHRILPV